MKKTTKPIFLFLSHVVIPVVLFSACESPANQLTKNSDLNNNPGNVPVLDRGLSVLLTNTVKSEYVFGVDLSGFIPTSKGEFSLASTGKTLFNQDVLLVPLYSQLSNAYMFTKYDGHLEDPIGYIGQLDPEKIKSPFDIASIDYNIQPRDQVEFSYFVVDGKLALDTFKTQIGLVTDPVDDKSLSYFPQLSNYSSLAVNENEITLICLLKQKVLHVTRKFDVFCNDFTTRRSLSDAQSATSFYNDYGDATCSSLDLGGYVVLQETYYYKNSPYTFNEMRTALAEYAMSFFNLTGVKSLSDKTSEIMKTIQIAQPYRLANSGAGITLPTFPKTSEFPQVLADFTAKMKDGNNLWPTDLAYRKY